MRFRVLGPVRMAPRAPTAAKPRVVLATLLMQSNSVVSTHALIDELWSEEPPRTAATTLQVYVSHLRKALVEGVAGSGEGAQPLLTVPPGYQLRVAADDLDLLVFETLRDEGRAAYGRKDYAEASRRLSRALALWTGPALSGIPHGPTLQTSAIRLDELRLEALEQRISAELRMGRHQELIGELMALAHEHPLRETLHCHLMVALYRSGRQSDALHVYHRARRGLVDELGVEPGPVMSRLLERILASDASLTWQRDTPAAPEVLPRPAGPVVRLPGPVDHFTGRTAQLALGQRFLAGAGPLPGRVLALSGRAGAGKTALAARLAHDAGDLFPDGRVLLLLRDAGGRALTPHAALSTLLRRLRGGSQDAAPVVAGEPGAPVVAPEPEPADLLYELTKGRKMLFVLDDAVSEAQVRPVLAALPDSTVLLTGRHALGALDGVQHLVLDVFSREEAEELLVRCGGPAMREDPAAVSETARLCGNLPLALRVAAAGLAARPHWSAAELVGRLADERTRLSSLELGDLDVRSSLLTAYRDVGIQGRQAFRLLGLAPLPDFALWSAAALLATELPEAERHTEELVRAQLLEARSRPGQLTTVRYSFHPLLRSLSLELLDKRPVSATDRLGRAFLALARHADSLLAPGRDPLGDTLEPPAGISPDALIGSAPLQWFREEAAGLLETVRQAHAAGLWQLCSALASASAGYYEAGALWDDWELGHQLALDAARQAGDPHAEAAVLRSLGDLAWQRQETTTAVDRYRLAWHLFTRCGDRASAARCLSGEADVMLGQGRGARAERCYVRALSAGQAENDPRGIADALRGLALVALREGRTAEARGRLTECAAQARRAGDRRWEEYATRTLGAVDAADAAVAAGRGGDLAGRPLEVRPGVWLLSALGPALPQSA
ncbi:SARP family transcriptional regulator [Streptomyces longisporoflavus]|uniref:AfsR/SARP family transcriptional regulator n=1 Tax=Streptomyces longisporoflavus TaxID=28044 RepID=UPI00167D495C|nr:AfsR/SARP family transcriptional regulator [Streptomyces longisporoflavus]GGV61807.1 SARP family transcriptional regulator [Streptomyces longisporoflavus]